MRDTKGFERTYSGGNRYWYGYFIYFETICGDSNRDCKYEQLTFLMAFLALSPRFSARLPAFSSVF